MAEPAYTILGLEAENVRRLKVLHLQDLDPTGVITIAGENNQGKTTVLHLLIAAVDLRQLNWVTPVREGEERASDTIVLRNLHGADTLRLERTWRSDGKTELKVFDPEGIPIKSPQAFLDGIVGAGIGCDPSAYARMKPGEMVDELLRVLQLPEDPRELDLERARIYDRRTVAGRALTQAEVLHKVALAQPPLKGTPTEEVSLTALAQVLEAVVAQQGAWDKLQAAATKATDAVRATEQRIDALTAEISAAKLLLADQGRAARQVQDQLGMAGPRPVADEAHARLNEAEQINVAVRGRREYDAAVKAVEARRAEVATLSNEITAIDQRKRDLLASAQMPIPGLGFKQIGKDWHVTFEEHPITDLSDSAKMRVGLAMAIAGNPKLRVILLKEAAFLDADNRAMVKAWALANGVQVWMELVGDHDEAFVIADGELERLPKQKG